jgi:electron transport complex protein RnfA
MGIDFGEYLLLVVGAVFVNNFVLNRFLGLCPYVGVSREYRSSMGMGLAVIFVMTLAGAVTWCVYNWLLVPLKVPYLDNVCFILIIASLVQLVEMFLQKNSPGLYSALGIFLPLITTNCAVLGVAFLNTRSLDLNFPKTIVHSLFAAIGFMLALLLIAAAREQVDLANIPRPFRGAPITLVLAGLMALAFMGFAGMRF